MKTNPILLACSSVILVAVATEAQGTFQNLGFESPLLVPIPGDPFGRIQFSPAFPGWTGYVGGVQQTAALYNGAFLDSSGIGILDHGADFVFDPFLHGRIIQGNFTAILQAGFGLGTFEPADTMLAQSAQVPVGTQSLQFSAFPDLGPSGSFVVTIDGQDLSLIPLATGANYTTFGADIHSWAGQTAELGFTVFADRPHRGNVSLFLDSIQFSNQPIPEPSVFGLFGLGALLLGWRFLRGRSFSQRSCSSNRNPDGDVALKPAQPPSNRSGRTGL